MRNLRTLIARQKVLKVAKIKDANYGCKDEGNDDGKVDEDDGKVE